MKHSRTLSATLDRILDHEVYQVITRNHHGDIVVCESLVIDMTREAALEEMRAGNALKVKLINYAEDTIRDVTDEIEGEIEFEREQAIIAGETYVPMSPSDIYYANSAGRGM
ncbi:hypothetical protein [Phyllobacterium leguminum]|uniref:Uncharacterized protein n=1 Tax=Phyllobacterium leguminum TaxID=314237 RepID=A0A318T5S5_9HYPH|nr:hypothetical protein [Phyllobacterium leguminum]PYE89634.1 hypothetical protein C7477_103142 [Phyllobacterium leguminum]